MTKPYPTRIEEFLSQLREALSGADPAVVQDALYDSEEYLRAEQAENLDLSEAELLQKLKASYGTPDEVAAAYQQTEKVVYNATRSPKVRESTSWLGRFLQVYRDPKTYTSLFYMLLTLATGIFYFTWAVTGLSMSVGFAILIIGIPFFLLFMASIRLFSLIEGRIIEVFLGERMPRRLQRPQGQSLLEKIKEMLSDRRTWTTLVYMLLLMPLGILYFTVAIVGLVVPLSFMFAPLAEPLFGGGHIYFDGEVMLDWPETLLLIPVGFVTLTLVLHLVRIIGDWHGKLGKHLLVKSSA